MSAMSRIGGSFMKEMPLTHPKMRSMSASLPKEIGSPVERSLIDQFRSASKSPAGKSIDYADRNAGVMASLKKFLAAQGKGAPSPLPTERQPAIQGDVNGDGAVTADDASTLLRYLFQGSSKPAGLDNADANGDGKIDLADVVKLSSITSEEALPE